MDVEDHRHLGKSGTPGGEERKVSKRGTIASVIIVMTCTLGMVINTSSNTIVAISLPMIGRELNIPVAELQWLMSAYALSSGCLLVFFGRVADLFGRKKTFIAGMSWMAIFSLACSFARSGVVLDVLRGLQGVGAAAYLPALMGILAYSFPPSRARSLAYATFAAGAPVGGVLGLALGGVLSEVSKQTWRTPFYLSASLSVICLIGGLISFDSDQQMMAYSRDSGEDRSIDWIGALLITAGLVLILVVLGQGEVAKDGWKTPYIIALLILGVILIGAFLRWQHHLEQQQNARRSAHLSIEPSNPILATSDSTPNKAENIRVPDEAQPHPPWKVNMRILSYSPPPLMKLSLWTRADGRLAAAMGIAFLGWCAFLGWTFWTQLYYQRYAGYPPVETVKRLLPMFVCGILCNLFVGFFVGRVPIVYLLVIGTLSTSTACLLFALIIPSASYWAFGFPAASLSVVGADFIFSSGTLFIAKVSRDDEQSLAGALFQTMTQLGTATGMAISTVVFNRVMKKQTQLHGPGEDAISLAQLNSYKAAQWTCFGFGILATLLAIVFFRSVGIVGTVKKGAKQEDSESQKSGRSPDVTFVNEEK